MFSSTRPVNHCAVSIWTLKESRTRTRWSSRMRVREGRCWGCPAPGHSSRSTVLWGARGHRCTHPEETCPLGSWRCQWSGPGTVRSPGWTGEPGSPTSSAGWVPHRRLTGRGSDPAPPGTPGRPHGRKQTHQSPVALCRERETMASVNNADENRTPCKQLMWQENRSGAGSISPLMDAEPG